MSLMQEEDLFKPNINETKDAKSLIVTDQNMVVLLPWKQLL